MQPDNRQQLQRLLAHVRRIGGSPCAGKSSIVMLPAERPALEVYRCDEHVAAHTQRVEPSRLSIDTLTPSGVVPRRS